jgi:hypothetical protein
MPVPPNLLKNTEAALAFFAAVLAAGGLLLSAAAALSVFLFANGLQSSVGPQIDSAANAVSDMQGLLGSAQASAGSASAGLEYVSVALQSYSESSGGIADSLSSISAIPPFSLDTRLSTAASKLKDASAQFQNASQSLNESSSSLLSAVSGLNRTSGDLGSAEQSLRSAQADFAGAVGMLKIASVAGGLALVVLFGSVLLLSLSILLSHYPRFFAGKESGGPGQKKR